ncbi:NADPH-dependent 2,4-dienoyl-CoA reductase, sulfur reductase [Raineyella antarctica]|uniref:NADPH-dependent 2,4-dienoyl-CoA reductase, sulfur reductase n=1 Tax=Raineyella antarctica TaxID=1577474 RepID=A0A1G6GEL8_9ACTN|nr:FAD-dependent oxidoreductase [Raineyella antarctica]SDB80451.1 NADPH-dependent 2,4-dienoyl-CoA reductase, sulfur reductase [Raineyella antarctica]
MAHLVTIGGSDAGISAALRARELDPTTEVTVLVADDYPNFSICGIPYHVSGEVPTIADLAHRTGKDLAAAGLTVLRRTLATSIDATTHTVTVRTPEGTTRVIDYDSLVIGTGATSMVPPIAGLRGEGALGPTDGVHTIRTIDDTRAVVADLDRHPGGRAVIVGAGYIGLEMAEGLVGRGMSVTQVEALPEVLSTVDAELGSLVHAELVRHGVDVHTATTVDRISRDDDGLRLAASGPEGPRTFRADLVVVVVGVRPDTRLAVEAGVPTGAKGALVVDDHLRTALPDVYAAGDCAETHHRLLGTTWLPLGTTAHKQGRIAGANAVGADVTFPGIVGTQVVKVFDLVIARTGLRDHEAGNAGRGWSPLTVATTADDHKRYYPGATPLHLRITGDRTSGRLLGAQLVGQRGAEVAKRVDTYATALFHEMTVAGLSDLDLSYTPPLGAPWDAVQVATQAWEAAARSRTGDQSQVVTTWGTMNRRPTD